MTPAADEALAAIFDYINADNPEAAARYYSTALDTFFGLPDGFVPHRASDSLPEVIRALPVPGFGGYTLRIAILDDAVYLITALRPGLTDKMKDDRTLPGWDEV
ncbi:type II toxin-antitoxin system RelE/ParE family toxin [Jannaschia pagri]|uniref:type II toxin-antitoxin system RelE/ParE family toxin n=1 Tax=Jannaschia pagri TaxID=2829797 RepID=UPI001C7D6732|nr:type II toxin-antitoxin system RelE/ParE family toxin [Jannaschia sp. AI_62]